jgi:hypothetical protein
MRYQAQDHLQKLARPIFAGCPALLLIFEGSGRRRKSVANGEAPITIYGFSVVREGLEILILLDYQREWEKKTGQRSEIIIPRATIFSEHLVVIIDHVMSPSKYALAELFVRSLWEPKAQQAWIKSHFSSVTDETSNEKFPKIDMPFYAKDLGGWSRDYPEIVEDVWKQKIQVQGE